MKDFWKKEIKKSKKLVFLAPMDWYWDSAYRQTMKKVNPCIYCISEFYSTDWLLYSKFLANSVLPHKKIEKPLIIQIFWKNPENFAKAAKIIESYWVSWIDVNMWCPAKKVVRSGHGSSLLINEEIAFKIIETLNKATKLPISVKTRLSFDGNQNLISFVKWLENAWASLITIHGRTAKQAYKWKADFTNIYELKKHVWIPIICNWDIENYEDGMNKVKDLDWFMIGRWSFWNPWCFLSQQEIKEKWLEKYWYNWQYQPTLKEILEIMKFHATKLVETKGEKRWSLEIRKHLVQYLKNFPCVKLYRKRIVIAEKLEDSKNIINEIKNDFKDNLEKRPGMWEFVI